MRTADCFPFEMPHHALRGRERAPQRVPEGLNPLCRTYIGCTCLYVFLLTQCYASDMLFDDDTAPAPHDELSARSRRPPHPHPHSHLLHHPFLLLDVFPENTARRCAHSCLSHVCTRAGIHVHTQAPPWMGRDCPAECCPEGQVWDPDAGYWYSGQCVERQPSREMVPHVYGHACTHVDALVCTHACAHVHTYTGIHMYVQLCTYLSAS